MGKRNINFNIWWPDRPKLSRSFWQYLIPHPGTLLLSLLLIGGLLWAQSVGALSLGRPLGAATASSTGTIAYQGRLADSAGSPLTGTYNMIFRLYSASAGGTPLWEEQWTGSNGVRVSDGLFNVMLGSLTQIPQAVVTGQDQLFLGITVGTDDEMAPRVQLGSVPFATQALTVPNSSITTAQIADGAVTQAKLGTDVSMVPPDGSVTTPKIADGAVTQAKLADASLVRTFSAVEAKVQYGHALFDSDACDSITITFPQPYTQTPVVIITQNESSAGYAHYVVFQVSSTGFRVNKNGETNCTTDGIVNWIAIGK